MVASRDKAHNCFSILKWPNIEGLDIFQGKLMHTGAWESEFSLAGKTVAVIGSGSSSVQVVPAIQPGTMS
jgi:cation diffusion facilitator CzcD-associated flavoprotein CzcO